jgi:hypothetical protein
MKRHPCILGKVGLAVLILIAAASALTAQTKVRVKDPAAVIRIEPASKGEIVQDKVAVGTVFTAERKAGEWYEIKYRSAIGVLLTGYIHESAVEDAGAEPVRKSEPEPIQKAIAKEERAETGDRPTPMMEFGLNGGMAFTSFTGASGNYGTTWSYGLFSSLGESGSINGPVKNPISLGASFTYYVTPNIGLRLKADFQTKQTIQSGTSNYRLAYTIMSTSSGVLTNDYSTSGEYSVMPISFNGIYRFSAGTNVNLFVTAGASYFTGKFNLASTFGYAWSWWVGNVNYLDYFSIPVSVNKSLSGIGFNAGAGLEFQLGGSFGLVLEADYFGGPSTAEKWRVHAGSYPSGSGSSVSFTIPASAESDFSDYIAPAVNIKLSFFKIVAGIKIGF